MKKDKKWLLHEFRKIPCELQGGHGRVKVIEILPLIDQLDEPKKPIIPQFVADHIRFSKEEENSPRVSMGEAHISKKLNDWLAKTEDYMTYPNQEKFMRAWLDGYEIKKEPLYYIKFSESQYVLRFYDGEISSILVSDKLIAGRFTEGQIKKMNPALMALAVEVAE